MFHIIMTKIRYYLKINTRACVRVKKVVVNFFIKTNTKENNALSRLGVWSLNLESLETLGFEEENSCEDEEKSGHDVHTIHERYSIPP